jgi:hypothetical protein
MFKIIDISQSNPPSEIEKKLNEYTDFSIDFVLETQVRTADGLIKVFRFFLKKLDKKNGK